MDVIPDGKGQATPAATPVEMISRLLDAEKVIPDKPKEAKPEAKPEVKPEVEAQPEKDASEPGNNAQVEGADAGDKPAVAEIPLDQLEAIALEVTTKGEDGKDVVEKPTIKELREGYMRQKDYSRKTAELARQRNEVGNTTRQGIEAERTQYANTLQQLQTTILELVAPELKDVNWNDLAANNPFEYVRLSNRRDQVKQALEGVSAKQQELKTKTDSVRRQTEMTVAKKTWETLESDIPGWNAELYAETLKASETLGYNPGEAGQWLDPRAVKLLHKAYLYDQLKAGKPPVEKKVAVAPVAVRPGATSVVSKATQQRGKAMDQLRKSGKLDDLASVIASMG